MTAALDQLGSAHDRMIGRVDAANIAARRALNGGDSAGRLRGDHQPRPTQFAGRITDAMGRAER